MRSASSLRAGRSVATATALAFGASLGLYSCSRTPPPSAEPVASGKPDAASPAKVAASASKPVPANATSCTGGGPGGVGAAGTPACFRFATPADAFRWVVEREPSILAIGEAHAQKGTESIASSTKRFTETFLPIVAPRSSDIVVELWAPDPKCMHEVKQVASAQKPIVTAQASTNQNEYLTLGTKAKEAGMTPWLLQPTCDDFSMLADAGDDAVGAMLGLVKRLTQARVTRLYERNQSAQARPVKTVVTYGGALHNDLSPPEETKEYSFGPELDRLSGGKYIELDLIVPEYVKKSPTWEKLAWYASFDADHAGGKTIDKATLYAVGERSFVLVFPNAPNAPNAP